MMYKPKLLTRTQFGNPILQQKARHLTVAEIKGEEIQHLIADMSYTLGTKKYGVGLAAPQVGIPVAASVIDIQPKDPNHPQSGTFKQVIINPEYTGIGRKIDRWEGCLSFGSKNSPVFAQTKRYKKIRVTFYDQIGRKHQQQLEGLPAHVFQHETDHLNGILFPQRVVDHTTWMNHTEYRKMLRQKREK